MSTANLPGREIIVPLNSWDEAVATPDQTQILTTDQLRGAAGVAIITGSAEGEARAYLQHFDLFDDEGLKALENADQVVPGEGEQSRAIIMTPGIRNETKVKILDKTVLERSFRLLDEGLSRHLFSICLGLLGSEADVSVHSFNQADVARHSELGRLTIQLGLPTGKDSAPRHIVVANSVPQLQTSMYHY